MILVSCCNEAGGIFTIDEQTFEVNKIIDEEARGIVFENGFMFVSTHNGLRLYQQNGGPDQWRLITRYDAKENWHGITIEDTIVYCAVSKQHTILCFDKLLNPYFPERYDLPRAYPNDLCFFKGDLYYCLPRLGKIMRWKQEVPLLRDLQMPHSLAITSEYIYTCNSAIGQVLRLRRDKECTKYADSEFEVLLKVPEYTRGIYLDNNYVWMGLSRHRRSDKPKYRCGVVRKNLATGHEDFIALPADEVYDITKM